MDSINPPGSADEYCDTPVSKVRVMGLVAQAVRRFGRAVNPPIAFGRPSCQGSMRSSAGCTPRASTSSDSSEAFSITSTLDASSTSNSVPKRRGKKARYLFAPLPPTDWGNF